MPLLDSAIVWAAIAIFATFQGLLVADAIRRRRSPTGGSALASAEVAWVAAPAVILILLGLFAFQALRAG